jgi:hypothetical protein
MLNIRHLKGALRIHAMMERARWNAVYGWPKPRKVPSMIAEIYQFNNECLNLEERPLNPMTHKAGEHDFMVTALNEEIEEYIEGFEQQDVVKMADSLIDLCYFAIGGLRRMGITEDQARACFLAIHNANMTKKKGSNAKRGDFADDAVKPADFIPADVQIAHILLEVD